MIQHTTTEMQLVNIDRLVPYQNNARTHSPEQINKLRASLREFGFINPVIIDRKPQTPPTLGAETEVSA